MQHADAHVRRRAAAIFGAIADRAEVVAARQGVLAARGDPAAGRESFQKHCVVCHRLTGAGGVAGPDLQPLRNRGAAFFLTNILDPNREVDPRFESYVAVWVDGRVTTGVLVEDSTRAVTLASADGKTATLAREEIETLQSTGRSLMPEGFEQELDDQRLADLIAYLVSESP